MKRFCRDHGAITAKGILTISKFSSTTRKLSITNVIDAIEDLIQLEVSLLLLLPRRTLIETGLSVHMTQVHKESLDAIENALPNRAGLEVEIFGMEGIPEDVRQAHNQRVIAQFSQAEADRRASSGNSAPGSAGSANPAKKAKFESPSDLKKRLAEHKAKMAEEAAAKAAQANQIDQIRGQSPGYGQPPGIVSRLNRHVKILANRPQ